MTKKVKARRWVTVLEDEQETQLNVYCDQVTFYTACEKVYKAVLEVLGEPTNEYYIKKKLSGVRWVISQDDKLKIKALLKAFGKVLK